MTNIAEIFTPPATANSSPIYSNATSSEDVMGKEDFLTLLVAQLQNQDPMNPDDPTEFTAQLAQFSSLEQLFNLNESMDEMAVSQVESDRLGAIDLIGKDIVYTGSTFMYDGEAASVGYQLDGTAASVNMYIQDENGNSIATLHPTELTDGNHFLQWNGLDNDGEEVPTGKYTIVLQASSTSDELTVAVSPLVQSEVTGVNFANDSEEAILHTLAGAEINTASVISVLQAGQSINTDPSEDDENSASERSTNSKLSGVTGTSTPQNGNDSAPTDEEQVAHDLLQYYLAG